MCQNKIVIIIFILCHPAIEILFVAACVAALKDSSRVDTIDISNLNATCGLKDVAEYLKAVTEL